MAWVDNPQFTLSFEGDGPQTFWMTMEEIDDTLDFYTFHVVRNRRATPCVAVLPSCRVVADAGSYSMDSCTGLEVTLEPLKGQVCAGQMMLG